MFALKLLDPSYSRHLWSFHAELFFIWRSILSEEEVAKLESNIEERTNNRRS